MNVIAQIPLRGICRIESEGREGGELSERAVSLTSQVKLLLSHSSFSVVLGVWIIKATIVGGVRAFKFLSVSLCSTQPL